MVAHSTEDIDRPHSVSIVIPVYQGARTLGGLLAEIAPLTEMFCSPAGHHLRVAEVLLVHDNGPDASAEVMRELAQRYEFVRTVWLSRNFGQHPATLAGMASSGGDWIVTMDEDGQHDPAFIGPMLDVAMRELADVVYARPVNDPPHSFVRNLASRTSKKLLSFSTSQAKATEFQSYRLVLGEISRSVAAYAGAGVYLDVALGWVAKKVATCPVELREEGSRASGYSLRTLFSHFWRMVLSSGTRALRMVSLLGVLFALGGFVLAIYLIVASLFWDVSSPQGWPSLMVALLVCSGAILFSLGVIAEYVGVAVNMAMGKPLYLIVSDPSSGPLGRVATPDPPAPPQIPEPGAISGNGRRSAPASAAEPTPTTGPTRPALK